MVKFKVNSDDWFKGHLWRPTYDDERITCIHCEAAPGTQEAETPCPQAHI